MPSDGWGQSSLSKKVYQNEQLIGLEKYNSKGQIILSKGVINSINDTVKESIEHHQFFYNDSGDLELEIEGQEIYSATIKSYHYKDQNLSSVRQYVNSRNVGFDLFDFNWPVYYFDSLAFSNLYPIISDTLWFTKEQVQKEMKSRTPIEIKEVFFNKGNRTEYTYTYGFQEGIEHASWDVVNYDFETGKQSITHYSDCMGRRTGIFYPYQIATGSLTYNSSGQLIEIEEYGDGHYIDYDSETTYQYDSLGFLIRSDRSIRQFDNESDYRSNDFKDYERKRYFKYDDSGNLISEQMFNTNGKKIDYFSFNYNSHGDMTQFENSKNEWGKIKISYNPAGLKKTVRVEKKTKDEFGRFRILKSRHDYKYDISGRVIHVNEKIQQKNEEVEYEYKIIYE